jgi:hypothetical protein
MGRGERQHVADVVEAVARIVRRDQVGHFHLHAQQVVERVLILDPVEPPQGHPPGVGILRIHGKHRVVDPRQQLVALGGGRLILVERRHQPVPDVIADAFPKLAVGLHFGDRVEAIERQLALTDAVAVTVMAEGLQHGLYLAFPAGLHRGDRGLALHGTDSGQGDEGKGKQGNAGGSGHGSLHPTEPTRRNSHVIPDF